MSAFYVIYSQTNFVFNNKARLFGVELCYIDGLVSTGNQIPFTILKIIFANQKNFAYYFINIFIYAVDKAAKYFHVKEQ